MKVAVVNPPFMDGRFSRTSRSPAIVKSGTMYWPFWLAYSVGTLERSGHDVLFYDCPAENITKDQLLEKLKAASPAMIVLDTSTPSIHSDLSISREIKELLPQSSIFLVGTHVSALPEEVLLSAPFITGIAAGEYDLTIPALADALQKEEDTWKVPGVWLNSEEKPFFTGHRELLADLDFLPMLADVYRKHLKPENYFFAAARYPSVMIITSRGCPFKCSYCLWPQVLHGGTYRSRSPQNVAEEFIKVQKYFPQVQEIVFEDDTFSVDSRRVEEVERARKPMVMSRWRRMVRAYAKRNGYRVGQVYWRAHNAKHVRENPYPPYEGGFFRAYVHRDGKRHRLLCRWIPERGWRVAHL